GDLKSVIAFTRTKHRANRLADFLVKHGVVAARIHGNRSQTQRTDALKGFKDGKYRVLVATDIAARGIDVEDISHVVNFDVPHVPDDYIHRVGRTARAEATGDAFTFVAPDEEVDLRAIERAVGKRLPRITVPGFDYQKRPADKFEIPIGERIAQIRARKAEERGRAEEKAERRAKAEEGQRTGMALKAAAPRNAPARPGGPPRPAYSHGPRPHPASSHRRG
ncbi:MAG TPA: helicase-related protein, partial [Thermoanaerobaculia bacterium]